LWMSAGVIGMVTSIPAGSGRPDVVGRQRRFESPALGRQPDFRREQARWRIVSASVTPLTVNRSGITGNAYRIIRVTAGHR
jgi:hypothetical protein